MGIKRAELARGHVLVRETVGAICADEVTKRVKVYVKVFAGAY